jgi:uncharacterized protein YecA (UPF0149 family)
MHDPTIEDAVLVEEKVTVDLKVLEEDIKLLAKMLKCTQAIATTALGYVIKITGKTMTAKEAFDFIQELIKTKGPEALDMDERLLCITIGVLKRKVPFIASASKIGRNDPCPCKSGAKYKNCCLELAKAHDYNRFYGGSTPR